MKRREFLKTLVASMPVGMVAREAFCSNLLDSHVGEAGAAPPANHEELLHSWVSGGGSFFYWPALREMTVGTLVIPKEDLQLLAVMTRSSASFENESRSLEEFSQLDEFDGDGYERKPINYVSVEPNGAIGCADIIWKELWPGASGVLGFLIIRARDALPIFWIGAGHMPLDPTGGQVRIHWGPGGLMCYDRGAPRAQGGSRA